MIHFSEVSEELAYYISTEKKANLPGIGSFEAIPRSAKKDPSSNVLLPPSEFITFTTIADDDLSFVDFINDSFEDEDTYSDFQQHVYDQVSKSKSAELPGLGTLRLNRLGLLRFNTQTNSIQEEGLEFEKLSLNPINLNTKQSEVTVSNAPGEANKSSEADERGASPLLRIGMITSVFLVCLALYFNKESISIANASPQQVSTTNINISPVKNKDIIIASSHPEELAETLDESEQNEIAKRQEAMTVPVKTELLETKIVTNTFGNKANVKKQLDLIDALGYVGDTWKKPNGLTSTVIILQYEDQAHLEQLFTEILENFPRAREL